jgi:hypothetical protein
MWNRGILIFARHSTCGRGRRFETTSALPAETTVTSGEADTLKKKKKSSKTAEGGADKDIRPLNKQLRGSVASLTHFRCLRFFFC